MQITMSVGDSPVVVKDGVITICADKVELSGPSVVKSNDEIVAGMYEAKLATEADQPTQKKGLETYEEYRAAKRMYGQDPNYNVYLSHIAQSVAGLICSSHMRVDKLSELLAIVHQDVLRETQL